MKSVKTVILNKLSLVPRMLQSDSRATTQHVTLNMCCREKGNFVWLSFQAENKRGWSPLGLLGFCSLCDLVEQGVRRNMKRWSFNRFLRALTEWNYTAHLPGNDDKFNWYVTFLFYILCIYPKVQRFTPASHSLLIMKWSGFSMCMGWQSKLAKVPTNSWIHDRTQTTYPCQRCHRPGHC